MEFYMNDVFQLTMESMNCGSDEIALQVVYICDILYKIIGHRILVNGLR